VAEDDGSIRQTTKNFDIFVAVVLIITLFVPLAFPLTGIFVFGAATATAVDANTCFSVSQSSLILENRKVLICLQDISSGYVSRIIIINSLLVTHQL
jgi:hypothetical protein